MIVRRVEGRNTVAKACECVVNHGAVDGVTTSYRLGKGPLAGHELVAGIVVTGEGPLNKVALIMWIHPCCLPVGVRSSTSPNLAHTAPAERRDRHPARV